jgi:hypothetical protein
MWRPGDPDRRSHRRSPLFDRLARVPPLLFERRAEGDDFRECRAAHGNVAFRLQAEGADILGSPNSMTPLRSPTRQAEPFLHPGEIAIGMEKRDRVGDAPGGDRKVDRAAHGDALCAQQPVVSCRRDGEGPAAQVNDIERREETGNLLRRAFVRKFAQKLGEDQVAQQNVVIAECRGFRRIGRAQVVDPNRRIGEPSQPRRQDSRSSFQRIFPREPRNPR